MNPAQIDKAVYISYAWEPRSEKVVDDLCLAFKKKGVAVIRDKTDLGYKDQLKSFMQQIGKGRYVILVIGEKYLKSENCMFELLQIFKNKDFYDRIFPILLEDVKIFKASDRLEFVKYWEDEAEHLDQRIRELKNLSNLQGVTEDLNHYTEIRNNIANLTNILKDINALNVEKHIDTDFSHLMNSINKKMEADGIKKYDLRTLGKVVLVCSILILGGFLSYTYWSDSNKQQEEDGREDLHKDSIVEVLKDTILVSDESVEPPPIKLPIKEFVVELVLPSHLVNQPIFLNGKRVAPIEKNGIFIKIKVPEQNSGSLIQVRDNNDSVLCETELRIENDINELSICGL